MNRTFRIWDAGLNCKSQSHSCLNNCFSKTPTSQTSCTNLVYLECKFDLSLKDTESAGSPRLCDATVDNNCNNYKRLVIWSLSAEAVVEEHTVVSVPIAVIVVVIVVILVAACATCVTLLVCCLVPGCLIHCKRTGRRATHHLSPKFSEALLTK